MKSLPPAACDGVDLSALLQYLEASGRMGVARLHTSGGTARVWFRDGQLVDAESTDATGEAAITQLLSSEIHSYAIEYRPITRFPVINDEAVALLGKRPRRSIEWQRLVSSMPSLESVLTINDQRYARESNSLADLDVELLSLLDGRRTIVEVVADSGLDAVQAMQRLAWYFRTGLIRLVHGSRPPSNPPSRRHGESEHPPLSDNEKPAPPSARPALGSIRPVPTIPVESRSLTRKQSRPARSALALTQVGLGRPRAHEAPLARASSTIPPPPPSRRAPATVKMYALSLPSPNVGEEALRAPRFAEEPASLAADGTGSEPPPSGDQRRAPTPSETSNPFPSLQGAVQGERVLLGRYEVLSRIARGGMGTVYLCRATGEGGFCRLFALKVLRSHLVRDEAAAQRFLAEARIAARIYDPHVVGIVDVSSQGGQPFIVMDYVEGGSFQELLRRHPKYRPPRLVVPIILDALSGLHAVHTLEDEDGTPLGLVHCDVSPHNLLVGVDGNCRLSDFGVARLQVKTNGSGRDVRHGKPAYVSPEQVSGAPLDARTDLFSMGVILWTALTGERLFEASTHEATLANVRSKSVPLPSQVGLRPPPCFDRICEKALSRNPKTRYASAREMLTELRSVALAEGHLAPPTEVAEWVKGTFGAEIQVQRLGALDASRRGRAPGAVTRSLREVDGNSEPPPRSERPRAPERSALPATTDTVPTLVLPQRNLKKHVLIAAAIIGVLALAVTLAWPRAVAGLFEMAPVTDIPVDVSAPTAPPVNVRGGSATQETLTPRGASAVPLVTPGAATASRLDHYAPREGVE